ncbi:MAG: hypothetical protein LBS97_03800 [Treponema sp.]|jgi:hypothetical protein|nr:hypothetical protein [Treponema sp.]
MLYPPYPPEIAAKYGFVRRARQCYLYTQSGRRLTDLYQEAGRAILGWEGGNARTVFKNILNRGAAGSFASEETRRLEKALQTLLPDFPVVRFYTPHSSLLTPHPPWWRPWLHSSAALPGDPSDAPAVLFLPPFPLANNCVILAAKTEQSVPETHSLHGALYSLFPPPVLAGITRSIYDLLLELPRRDEHGWKRYDQGLKNYWERHGPYLFPKIPRESYGDFASRCLDAGLVISPDFDIPSIIPWGAQEGDFSRL